MSSRPLDGLGGGGQIAARHAHERVRAEGRGDRVAARAHRQQIAVPDLGHAVARGCRRERARRAFSECRVPGEDGPFGVQHGRRPQVDRQRRKPPQRARRRQAGGAHARTRGAAVGPARDNARVTFTRIAWLVTVLACIVTGIALLLSGYVGYAAVFGAVGACAAINLR
jgi:hypothetical protein